MTEFYRLWDGREPYRTGAGDRGQARRLVREFGPAGARELVPFLVQVVRRSWPECKSLSGAVDKYLADAVRACAQGRQRSEQQLQEERRQRRERQDQDRWAEERQQLEGRWQALSDERRREIEQEVLRRHPEHQGRPGILKVLCLKEL